MAHLTHKSPLPDRLKENSEKNHGKDSESGVVSEIVISKEDSGGIKVCVSSLTHGTSSGASSTTTGASDSCASVIFKKTKVASNKKMKKKNRGRVDNQDTENGANDLPKQGYGAEDANCQQKVISSKQRLQECRWEVDSLAKAPDIDAMERADLSPYTSDEWEDSATSDTEGDHTDSSDDDDPKSQVDRLIEQGTQLYIEGENSGLSSDDESDESDYDSESDITDVSPLVSATASPLGLSPVLSRRTIPTSPLALHDNRELEFDFLRRSISYSDEHLDHRNRYSQHDNKDATNMDLLLQAIMELENGNVKQNHLDNKKYPLSKTTHPQSPTTLVHPVGDNPHYRHLKKNNQRRKNMSFSNEEVRKIDRENKILLKKIMAAHNRGGRTCPSQTEFVQSYRPSSSKTSSSCVSRRREEEKIRRENMILLRKIQEAKPSKEITSDRRIHSGSSHNSTHHHHVTTSKGSHRGLRTSSASCGASMRRLSSSPHVVIPPAHKEPAL